ncbi:MAG TPA: hypothetical protein VIG33_09970 [Pseudobdellovibrionaceae bacterium]|jgi:hypothetical protein
MAQEETHKQAHKETYVDLKQQEVDKKVAKEMLPFFIYAAIPVLIIVFIALKWGPSY